MKWNIWQTIQGNFTNTICSTLLDMSCICRTQGKNIGTGLIICIHRKKNLQGSLQIGFIWKWILSSNLLGIALMSLCVVDLCAGHWPFLWSICYLYLITVIVTALVVPLVSDEGNWWHLYWIELHLCLITNHGMYWCLRTELFSTGLSHSTDR